MSTAVALSGANSWFGPGFHGDGCPVDGQVVDAIHRLAQDRELRVDLRDRRRCVALGGDFNQLRGEAVVGDAEDVAFPVVALLAPPPEVVRERVEDLIQPRLPEHPQRRRRLLRERRPPHVFELGDDDARRVLAEEVLAEPVDDVQLRGLRLEGGRRHLRRAKTDHGTLKCDKTASR